MSDFKPQVDDATQEGAIYLYCLSAGTGNEVSGYALAEDGQLVAFHYSSNVDFAKYDLGLTSNRKHSKYQEKYPAGYRLVWVDEGELDTHAGFQAAWALSRPGGQ